MSYIQKIVTAAAGKSALSTNDVRNFCFVWKLPSCFVCEAWQFVFQCTQMKDATLQECIVIVSISGFLICETQKKQFRNWRQKIKAGFYMIADDRRSQKVRWSFAITCDHKETKVL